MRTYERSGVHVDQCAECRGIFLDRGELERLIDGEHAWAARPAPASQPSYQPSHGSSYDVHPRHHKRRKSFLEELFD